MEHIIDLYKTILEQETSNYNTFIWVLLGLVAIILGATWWWNKTGANSYIKTSVVDEFQANRKGWAEQMEQLVDRKLQEKMDDFDMKIIEIEADLSRSFGYALNSNGLYSHSISYFASALGLLIKQGNQGYLERAMAELILSILENDLPDKGVHRLSDVKEEINKLPDILRNEKEKINIILESCTDI